MKPAIWYLRQSTDRSEALAMALADDFEVRLIPSFSSVWRDLLGGVSGVALVDLPDRGFPDARDARDIATLSKFVPVVLLIADPLCARRAAVEFAGANTIFAAFGDWTTRVRPALLALSEELKSVPIPVLAGTF